MTYRESARASRTLISLGNSRETHFLGMAVSCAFRFIGRNPQRGESPSRAGFPREPHQPHTQF